MRILQLGNIKLKLVKIWRGIIWIFEDAYNYLEHKWVYLKMFFQKMKQKAY